MRKDLLKSRKALTSIACCPLMFVTNNLELGAEYLPDQSRESIKTQNLRIIEDEIFTPIGPLEKNNL